MAGSNPPIIDFHSHYFEAAWRTSPPPAIGTAHRVWPLLTNIEAQLDLLATAGIDAKVMTAPVGNLVEPGEQFPEGRIQTINDSLARLVTDHPGRLLALGTIDAFQGEVAAREVERVGTQLGFGGIVIDCARGDRYLDDPAVRPVFETAAALDLAVFIHPVSPAGFTERLARYGPTSVLLARGTENAASVLALLRSGLLDALPGLTVVIPAIGIGALIFAGLAEREYGQPGGWQGSRPSDARKRLSIDTMGLDPALIRFVVDLVGIDQVVFGTDWPIMPIATRDHILSRLTEAGVSAPEQQAAILSGNALRIFNQQPLKGSGNSG